MNSHLNPSWLRGGSSLERGIIRGSGSHSTTGSPIRLRTANQNVNVNGAMPDLLHTLPLPPPIGPDRFDSPKYPPSSTSTSLKYMNLCNQNGGRNHSRCLHSLCGPIWTWRSTGKLQNRRHLATAAPSLMVNRRLQVSLLKLKTYYMGVNKYLRQTMAVQAARPQKAIVMTAM